MPEMREDQIPLIALFEDSWQQAKVVVLDEDECRLIAGLFQNRLGEDLVHLTIDGPMFRVEHGTREDHVAQWPETLIGGAVVVALLLFFRQPNAAQRVLWFV